MTPSRPCFHLSAAFIKTRSLQMNTLGYQRNPLCTFTSGISISFPALIDCFSGEVMRQCEPSSEHCTSLFLRRNGSFSFAAFRPVKLYGQQPGTDFSNKVVSYVRESKIEEQQMSFGGSEVLLGWYGKCESGKGFLF